jgi:tetratricopeptide (TPR) repeat protein
MKYLKWVVPVLIIIILVYDRLPGVAQVTLWETYQAAGHQAIEEQRVADAERLLLAAAKHIEAINPDDPRLANTLNDLGVLYGMQNRDVEAEPLFERALVIHEQTFGRQHPFVILTLQNLSLIYASQEKYLDAHRVARESLEISLQLFGLSHPRTGSTCRTLATIYELQGYYEAAEQFTERSLAIFEETVGEVHPETTQSLETMIRLLWMTHREHEAQQFEARLNRIRYGSHSEANGMRDLNGVGEMK